MTKIQMGQILVMLAVLPLCQTNAASLHRSSYRGRHTEKDFWQCAFPGVHLKTPPAGNRTQPAASLAKNWDGCMKYVCATESECKRAHHAMAENVMRVLNCTNSAWVPVFGTLLGMVRNQSLSPNDMDMDVDFAVSKPWFDYFSRPDSTFVEALSMLGYHVAKTLAYVLRVCIAPGFPGLQEDPVVRDGPYYDHYKFVDLFRMEAQMSGAGVGLPLYKIGSKRYEPSDIYPLQSMQYKGSSIPFPAKPEIVLKKLYGDWRVVRPSLHGV